MKGLMAEVMSATKIELINDGNTMFFEKENTRSRAILWCQQIYFFFHLEGYTSIYVLVP